MHLPEYLNSVCKIKQLGVVLTCLPGCFYWNLDSTVIWTTKKMEMSKIPWSSVRKESTHLRNSTHWSVFITCNLFTNPSPVPSRRLWSLLSRHWETGFWETYCYFIRHIIINVDIFNTCLNRITIARRMSLFPKLHPIYIRN